MLDSGKKGTHLPFWRQLRLNLVIYFVGLAIVPVVVAQLITLSLTSQNATNAVVSQLQSVAVLKVNQLERWIQETQSTMGVILADPSHYSQFVRFLASPDSQTTDQQAQINTLLLNVVGPTPTTATVAGITQDGAAQPFSLFKDLFLYDTSGHVVASSDDTLLGQIVNRQPYFGASLKDSSASNGYLQPPYYALASGELTMVLTYPLLDANKQVVGVLAGRLDMSTLGEIMTQRAGLGETGETYLVSVQTNYLLTPSRFDGFPLNQAYHSQGIDKALKGNNGEGVYDSYRGAGTQVIGVYQWVPQLQSALVAEIGISEALATTRQALTSSLIVTVIAALLAVLIGFVRITQISAPISALTSIAARITAGDLSQRANIHQRNEIGLMADSFNVMTEQLVTNINTLDRNLREIDKTNKALQVATAKAREAARLKGEFLANVSHELRTPLNAIIGFSDMLLIGMSDPLSPKQEHKVRRLRENGSRLLALINDLLDLTRIESGRLEIVQNAFSPRALIERVSAQMESLSVQTRLKFEVAIDDDVPQSILGDEKRTEQVVINLLSNAFKFTKEGGVTLHVYVDHAEQTLKIDVKDTGIGIPPHALNLIFEEFRQLDGSYSRAYKGSGLGLAITRNLARMMSGKVTVKSALGVGSTFTFTLPLSAEQSQDSLPALDPQEVTA